jgi:hypothetical protein
MASGGKEHRMVFDIRGRRKHVVKVVYAVLAVLMGASLFLVVGPVNLGGLLGNGSSSSSAAAQFEEQAERLERKLAKTPEDPDLLTGLVRARIFAGNQLVSVNPSTGETLPTIASVQQLSKASQAWSEYLKTTKDPAPGTAQLVAPALVTLAQTSRSNPEVAANINAAAEAQQIVAEQRPTLNSLSTFAFYEMYTFDFAAAEKAGDEAMKLANTKFERENLENQLKETEKRAHEFQKQLKTEAKEAKKGGGKPAEKESLENPLGGFGTNSPLGQ